MYSYSGVYTTGCLVDSLSAEYEFEFASDSEFELSLMGMGHGAAVIVIQGRSCPVCPIIIVVPSCLPAC